MSDEELSELFWRVARTLRTRARETLSPYDVSPSQSRALVVLVRHGGLRPGALAELLHIAPRSATEVVDDLERAGLVERRPDPADRRATRIAPTARGAEVGAAIVATRKAEADRFFGSLPVADRAELTRILRTLTG